ncbi:uncharacterized protein LOC112081524 [Eutrema salsugineum]|uniref:uncharacterized protein LOC112081524 n=1 Tax=Eutrema salsugineum TaxID=72664 RepID=UPI000CECFD1B|nr:uncharacterized protein LOC112081524 [Eutrema salsugineum]
MRVEIEALKGQSRDEPQHRDESQPPYSLFQSRDPARRSDESQPHENPFQPRDEPQSQYQNEEEEEDDSGGKGSEDALQRRDESQPQSSPFQPPDEPQSQYQNEEEIAKLKESKKKAKKPLPPSQVVNEPFKCNLINHNGNNDVVAIGCCYPSRVSLHNVPLKPGEVAVTVFEVKIDIRLWAPVDDIEMLRNAIGAFIVWSKEMVVHYKEEKSEEQIERNSNTEQQSKNASKKDDANERISNREEEKSDEQIEKNASEIASKKDDANERVNNREEEKSEEQIERNSNTEQQSKELQRERTGTDENGRELTGTDEEKEREQTGSGGNRSEDVPVVKKLFVYVRKRMKHSKGKSIYGRQYVRPDFFKPAAPRTRNPPRTGNPGKSRYGRQYVRPDKFTPAAYK